MQEAQLEATRPKQATLERATMPLWPDAARRLGIGRAAIYAAAKRGEVPIIKIGKRLLVPVAALEKLVGAA